MKRRSNPRRQRDAHNDRGVHLSDTGRAELREGLDDMARLMLLVAISAADTTMTIAELKAAICGKRSDGSSTK